jgi:hypothetical protein
LERQKAKDLTSLSEKERLSFEKEKEVITSRIDDLASRLKEREEVIAKNERDTESYKHQLAQLEYANQQYKEKIKNNDKDRLMAN